MKLSNLRVDTRPSDTLPLLTNDFRSDSAWPRISSNHQQQESEEFDSSRRMIRRTFAFDEWDEKNAQKDGIRSNIDDSTSSNKVFESSDVSVTIDDSELDLQHTILRSFAFDEWDKEEDSTDTETTSPTPSGRFAPVQNSGAVGDIESSPKKLPLFCRYKATAFTKFDLDESTATQPTVAVTPSPPPKLQRPVPLYSHQSIDFPANPFDHTFYSTTKQETNLPKDLQCMESMIRASFVPSFPLVCQSIPREASAFSIPTVNRDSFPPKTHNSDSNHRQLETPHWFDMYGSGTTLFEDDDYIFESPSSSISDEDSLFSASTIPRFIVCCQDDEWFRFY